MFNRTIVARIQYELEMQCWVVLDRLQRRTKKIFHSARDMIGQVFWGTVPYQYPMKIVCFLSALKVSNAEKSRKNQAHLNFTFALNGRAPHDHHLLWARKRCLEKALYFKNRHLLEQLFFCADKLQKQVDVIRGAGGSVIFAPMHCHSDVLSGLICSAVTPFKLTSISLHQSIGRQETEKLLSANVNVTVLDPTRLDTFEFMKALREVKKNEVNFLIYPDVLPEVTSRLTKRTMRTYDCAIFGRSSRLHSGLHESARMTGSSVLFYCLCEKNGRMDIDVCDVLPAHLVEKEMANMVEKCIVKHAESWLLWHSPSLFYFNSADR